MRRMAVLAVLAVLTSVVAGCSSDDEAGTPDPEAAETTTTAAQADYVPMFEPTACDSDRVPEDTATVECGTLVVPEDRTEADGPQVRLPVAIVRTASPTKQPDPIIYFSGGPGYPGIESSNGFVRAGLSPDRDLIFFDQRGTGAAEPSLDCPEYDESTYQLFETTDPPLAEAERQIAALVACRERLIAEGIDLAQYDTPTTAADVADLRTALGIDEWNLFGISYGTAVALEVLRAHPEGIRSVVIDSVVPPDEPLSMTEDFEEARRVFGVLYAGCAASAECAAAHPDLEQDLRDVVALLDADPNAKTITQTSRPVEARFTGGDLVAGIWNAMYDTTLIPLIPFFIGQMKAGNRAVLDPVASEGLAFVTGAAEGQTASVDCADLQVYVDEAQLRDTGLTDPLFGTLASAQPIPLVCDEWDVPSVEEGFHEIPESDVPVLVFGNEYDPITPPEGSEHVADALGAKATYVEFPGLGHGATTAAPCPLAIFQAFVADPTAGVDTACVATMPPPAWVIG